MIGRDHIGLPGVVALQDRLTQRLHLDKLAGLGEVGEILERNGSDPEAALLLGGDKRLAGQTRQRLAQACWPQHCSGP